MEIKYESPEPEAYCRLRKVAGMSEKSLEAAQKGLPHSCFDITLYEGSELIGMGRVIGDYGTTYQIVDVAVEPDFQGQGLGRLIMDEIMQYIESVALSGTYVSLIADYPADQLYAKFGFKSTEPKSCGMFVYYR